MASKHQSTDVCLILEGTYPYVSGGVSTWVHQIVSAYPDLSFSIFFLGAQKDPAAKHKYKVPPNVTHIEEVFLFDTATPLARLKLRPGTGWSPFYTALRKLCVRLPAGDMHDLELLRGLISHIASHTAVSFENFWQHPETWAVIRELYERYTPEDSFLDFYWTCCFLVQPLWKLARGLARVPKARLYHTACTGYAGLAAAIAAEENGAPMLLSEHGIYIRERIGDICRSVWIPERKKLHPALAQPLSSLRRLWIGFFDVLGRMCYQRADTVVSLFEKNAQAQRHFGADPARLTIIPNGIRTEECEAWNERRAARRAAHPDSQVIGFLGRVVSIKDVKTLLQTARKVCDALPAARFLIAGPTEEEKDYFEECVALSGQLNLQHHVEFIGPVKPAEFIPKLDLMILTSVSEGLPFVVIESLAAGVPVVSTDVGACAEILAGRPADSPPIGPCGLVAEVGAADQLAAACVNILNDPALLQDMSDNGRALASRHYHERIALGAYRELYARLMEENAKSTNGPGDHHQAPAPHLTPLPATP
ncbi:MAG: GT4 family glycosyltransferase PelF [Verrucomicrobiaceae bacterium]|nr:GT4 family glycosyltransferase PelF [Verrucomicrobiaceae bacterium]